MAKKDQIKAPKESYYQKQKRLKKEKSTNNENENISMEGIVGLQIESLNEREEVEFESIKQEIQISPLSANDFCKSKSIIGLNKDFLEKKYVHKKYSIDIWETILTKERLVN